MKEPRAQGDRGGTEAARGPDPEQAPPFWAVFQGSGSGTLRERPHCPWFSPVSNLSGI